MGDKAGNRRCRYYVMVSHAEAELRPSARDASGLRVDAERQQTTTVADSIQGTVPTRVGTRLKGSKSAKAIPIFLIRSVS